MSENTTATATTISEYVAAAGVTVDVLKFHGTRTEHSTTGGREWEYNSYRLRVNVDGRSIETPWRQGLGVTKSPDDMPADVFSSLVMDASGVENADGFEDWANDYGYDPDSRKAYKIYEACSETRAELRDLLGDDYEHVFTLENDI